MLRLLPHQLPLNFRTIAFLIFSLCSLPAHSGPDQTVRELMLNVVTPSTNTIWRAQDLKSDEDWRKVKVAAENLLQAGKAITAGGSGEHDKQWASNADWQTYNSAMIEATKKVLVAIDEKDEDALFEAGNLDLYPPCENCHKAYLKR